MSRPLPPELRRSRVFSVRLHPAEGDEVRARAIQQGLGLGDYLRSCCLAHPLPPVPMMPRVPLDALQRLHRVHAAVNGIRQRSTAAIDMANQDRHRRLDKTYAVRLIEYVVANAAELESELACLINLAAQTAS